MLITLILLSTPQHSLLLLILVQNALSRLGYPEKKDGKLSVTEGVLSPLDLWLQNSLGEGASTSNTKDRWSEHGSFMSSIIYTSLCMVLWAPALFCDEFKLLLLQEHELKRGLDLWHQFYFRTGFNVLAETHTYCSVLLMRS